LRDFPFKLNGSVLGKKVNLKGGTVFDPEETGRVVPNELLMAFSMSMKGTGNNGLKPQSKELVIGPPELVQHFRL
jgi:hypothetical protein